MKSSNGGIAAASLTLAIAAIVPALGRAADLPVTWGGISLGLPAAALRANLGDPLRVVSFGDSPRIIARYWIPGDNSTYVLVIDERGYVSGFEISTDAPPMAVSTTVPPDPSGVRLGDTMETVKSKHPDFKETTSSGQTALVGKISPTVAAIYAFTADRVQSIEWAAPVKPDLPALPRISLPPGDSPATAILDVQQNESDGVGWEYRFLSFHPCSGDVPWKLQSQALVHANGRSYDRLTVACPATSAQRDFYFDVTSYFGKM